MISLTERSSETNEKSHRECEEAYFGPLLVPRVSSVARWNTRRESERGMSKGGPWWERSDGATNMIRMPPFLTRTWHGVKFDKSTPPPFFSRP